MYLSQSIRSTIFQTEMHGKNHTTKLISLMLPRTSGKCRAMVLGVDTSKKKDSMVR